MDLFEYQGKQYFARFDIPVSTGRVAETADHAVRHAEAIGYPVVVKAQVRVGGRGKAGGIKVADDAAEVLAHATRILGTEINGHPVERLLIEQAVNIAFEYYASFTLDRSARLHLGLLSAQGGMDIEEVASRSPEAVARLHVDPTDGLDRAVCRRWVAEAGLDPEAGSVIVEFLLRLWDCYLDGDADLVEVNPLVVTTDGQVLALDAKVTLDDSAGFRHPDWEQFRTVVGGDQREQLARERGLQYVGLEGTVGIVANGAGLAMSTLDVVHHVGGRPANFLDVGGGAKAEVMANALEVVSSDPNVRSILVNIFGGITKGEEVANGIVEALGRVGLSSPIIVRLDGTNADQGRAILAEHESERLVSRPTMLDAARTAVELADRP